MNIELIVLQDSPLTLNFKEKDGILYYRSEMIIKCPVKIHRNINDIDFENEFLPTYYLLFVYNLDGYKELAKYSHKMVLMNAIYFPSSKLNQNFNFAGMVSLRHISTNYPMMFGLHAIINNMDNIPKHHSEIKSEKYGSIWKPDKTIGEIVQEYLLMYHEYMQQNKKS